MADYRKYMADGLTKAQRSNLMSRISGSGNRATELRLIQIFRANDITGWRRGCVMRGRKTEDGQQEKPFSVRPDFVFQKLRIAVFVDGCFWHGCPRHFIKPKGNAKFWRDKIAANRARDRKVNRTLRRLGWKVVRVWQHALKRRDEPQLVRRLMRILGRSA